MDKEEQILDKLSRIIDPDLHKDIVSLGFIKNLKITEDDMVLFNIELTTPACPVREEFRKAAVAAVQELDWVSDVDVTLTARRQSEHKRATGGLKQVRKIIGVSSCKGGVGKSTVATNLAFALQAQGAKVGIFDADIYGPSLPTMVDAEFDGLYNGPDNLIIPVQHSGGIKLMSFAYATPPGQSGPAIMRGPMVSQVVQQLLTTTNWGELDYLVIDLPPGTGDIQLTISQIVPMDASVMVTTPQKISFMDVVKGIQMFDKLSIPVVGVIENMSHFICDNCDERHEIFGRGAMKEIVEQFGIENAFEIPIVPGIARQGDSGLPFVAAEPDSETTKVYESIAASIVREISRLEFGERHPTVTYEHERGVVFQSKDHEFVIPPAELRRRCGCANCVHEFTGEKLLHDEDIPDSIEPVNVETMGNYAVSIHWSDDHGSIYPYSTLEEIGKDIGVY